MLKRIITGLILLAGFFCILFYTNANVFYWLVVALLLGSSWEWGGLIGLNSIVKRVFLVAAYLLAAMGTFWLPVGSLLIVYSLWWCFAFATILLYARGRALWAKKPWVGFLMGLPALGSSFIGFNVLRNFEEGATIVFYFILLIAAADSFAYFAGRAFGKRKLLEVLSPKKTWEGFVGGLIGSTCVAVGGGIYFHMSTPMLVAFVGVSLIAVLFSVIGDLFVSLLKRQQQLKDTGRLLPGHGGLLDRLDGLNAAVSVFTLGLILMTLWLK
ncbi:MAG: phosphatidate cytidylyltransferase [Pseudomonadota bacterium]